MKRVWLSVVFFLACCVTVKAEWLPTSGGTGSGSVATDTIFDADGDLVQGTGANTSERLPIGAAGTVLKSDGTDAEWSSSLGIATFDMGASTSSDPFTEAAGSHATGSVEGRAHYNTTTDRLEIGDGTAARAQARVIGETFTTPNIGAATGTSLTLTGALTGTISTVPHYTASVDLAAADFKGQAHVNATAITTYYNLPAATAGMNGCFYSHVNGSVIVNPNGTDAIHLNGSAQLTNGYRVASDGARGDFMCFWCVVDGLWATLGRIGTWASWGAD